MEFTFEQGPWEAALEQLQPGDHMDAPRFLTLLELEDEDTFEEAFLMLCDRGITLDISALPMDNGSGALALRLKQEKELAKQADLRAGLEDTDPLYVYLEELAGIPAFGDTQLLAEEYARGNESVAEQLVNGSLSRCVELAQERTGYGVLLLDLVQEASLGLWQGVLCYAEGDFEAHRDWWICQYLAKAVVSHARNCGVGQKLRRGMEDYRDVDQRLLSELGRNPTMEEIAEAMHISAEEAAVYSNMIADAGKRQVREEVPEDPAEEEQAVEDTAYFQSRQRIQELLSALSEEEAKLLTLRFGLEGGLPLSPEETGKKLGMTPLQVVETEATALSKLRSQ